jgi:hypothetical protein
LWLKKIGAKTFRFAPVVQWNCRGLRSKFPKFEQWSQNIDIIILPETWLDETESVYLKWFDVVRK